MDKRSNRETLIAQYREGSKILLTIAHNVGGVYPDELVLMAIGLASMTVIAQENPGTGGLLLRMANLKISEITDDHVIPLVRATETNNLVELRKEKRSLEEALEIASRN